MDISSSWSTFLLWLREFYRPFVALHLHPVRSLQTSNKYADNIFTHQKANVGTSVAYRNLHSSRSCDPALMCISEPPSPISVMTSARPSPIISAIGESAWSASSIVAGTQIATNSHHRIGEEKRENKRVHQLLLFPDSLF